MTPEQLTGQTDSHLVSVMIGQKAFLVHSQVSADLLALKQAAAQAGFNLCIASGFRSFEQQLSIWDQKMTGQRPILDQQSQPLNASAISEADKVLAILRWSALPGASRHHWGTDFDVYDQDALPSNTRLLLEPWEYLTGHQSQFWQWLTSHLSQFGFFFPYQDGQGVGFEPWHISHHATAQQCLSEFSEPLLQAQLTSAEIEGKTTIHAMLPEIYLRFITNICEV
ncbi:M15 family metallopeptidase [Vibrio sp. HDW18]|uniref:M15 family metallopeptidase n=1 Tax=Vibrio sp. HDW18 TaxID=2714948 RepID=UPI00140C3545|nr:M15 family metallopeptidase [Vibrio sp. HDW18]QIL84857.1 M15 family metallopeptidase [Vibrio sp. HDW18]